MKTLKIKSIDSLINIAAGNIENIIIENSKLYFSIVNSIIIDDNDYLIYSIDNDNKDLEKYSLLITTPFDLNPNNKKILTSLYKKIDKEKHILKINEELEIINYKIIKTLETISLDLNQSMNFNTELDLVKLLSLYDFSFEDDCEEDLLNKLVFYIKANLEINNIDIVFCIDILRFLSQEEMEKLKRELELLNICLINISFSSRVSSIKKSIVIDEDYCEL